MEQLDGQIDRILFRDDESGYSIFYVKVKNISNLVTITGTVPSINDGELVVADGEWINDPKYGRQFKASNIRTSSPDTEEGIEKYLASDLVKGIGKEYAARLVQAFGKEVFLIIEENSKRLLEVEGIGKTRKNNIKKAWDEQKNVRSIMSFLFSHGISTSKAFRIHKIYGDDAISIINRDPYCLARDIRGIGFLIADKIALTLGLEKNSIIRAQAGIEYTLSNLLSEGHCAYIKNDLISKTAALLDLDIINIENALENSISEKKLILEKNKNNEELIYLPKIFKTEEDLSNRLKILSKGKHPCPEIDVEKAISWAEEKINILLADDQKHALKKTISSKISVITGGPGVGKTTLLNTILMILKAKKMRVFCCAPTGRAAKRMKESTGIESKTIHRLLQYNPGTGGFVYNIKNSFECDVLIIDESSMIDLQLCNNLMEAVPLHAAIVLVGDIDQLPSVGPGKVLKDIIESNIASVSYLNQIFRQSSQSNIITFSHSINNGEVPNFDQSDNNSDCFFIEADDPDKALNLINKLVIDSIPRRFDINPIKDIQILSPMKKGLLGTNHLNQTLQKLLNKNSDQVERFGKIFRLNDRVLQTENDYDKDVFNGDLGYINKIDKINQTIDVLYDDKLVNYDFKELDMLIHSYAITIHKSQGSEYPVVIIPIHTQHYIMLKRTLFYTALTRAKKLAIIVGSVKAMRLAVKQTDTAFRTTMLSEKLF